MCGLQIVKSKQVEIEIEYKKDEHEFKRTMRAKKKTAKRVKTLYKLNMTYISKEYCSSLLLP